MVWYFPVPSNTFADPDNDPLTITATLSDGSALPSWITFDPTYQPYGRFVGMPENAGVFTGVYQLKVNATDGIATVSSTFPLVLGDVSGLPLYVAIDSPQPKVSVYDAVAPAGAGTAKVIIGLDKAANETVVFKITTQNGAGGANAGSDYTAKTEYIAFRPGERYREFNVTLLKALTTGKRVNILVGGIGSNSPTSTIRGTGYIMPSGDVASASPAFVTAPVSSGDVGLAYPAAPKIRSGWSTVFNPDLVNGFEANDDGISTSDGVTPCWYSKGGGDAAPLLGREQTGNSEDGYYVDPVVNPGTNPFPLVDTGGGVMKRALRAEHLDGTGGKPSSIASQYINKTYTYSASMITTRKNFPTIQTGDYIEVRAKMNAVKHSWPAIWLMPGNGFSWPPEIDLMEGFFSVVHPDRIGTTIHWTAQNKTYGSYFDWSAVIGSTFDMNAYHTWGCWIGATWLVFYLDDVPYMMVPNMPLSSWTRTDELKWYLLLNVAVGGVGSGGLPDNPGEFPVDMVLDYVKVWRKTS